MAGCTKCDGFSDRINFESPEQYRDTARQLIDLVEQGAFLLVKADCPLADLFKSPWPGDFLKHDFQCASCGRTFELFADTYHGYAGWKPVE